MKKSTFKIGNTVMTPVTDSEGEVSYVYGILVGLNQRFAKVNVDGKIVNVGKTKIEMVEQKKATAKKSEDKSSSRIASGYEYGKCTAASGRKSCDNGDNVALDLRGLDLVECYRAVSKAIGVPQTELKGKYSHLNPGQQRMCIGNRLRGFLRNQ